MEISDSSRAKTISKRVQSPTEHTESQKIDKKPSGFPAADHS